MDSTLILTAITTLLLIKNNVEGTFIRPEGHTLPVGLQPLDGSDTIGGCRQECLMGNVCGDCTGNLQLNSTLVDGVYPRGTIDTGRPDWAMDFFTVNRNGNEIIQIGFDFGTGFILRGVELKLFNCETLGTAISNIKVYTSLVFPFFSPPLSAPGPIGTYETVASDLDCDSLSTIIIPTNSVVMFTNYFIEFSFSEAVSNTALYLAEIRFSDEPIVVSSEVVTSTSQILPSSTAVSSSQLPVVTSSTTVLSLFSSSSPMPAPSTDIGSVVTTTSVPPANTSTSTFTPSINPPRSIPTSTLLSTSTAPTSVTTVSINDPGTILASDGLTTIVGVLVGVIVALVLIILIGVVAVALCYKNRNNLKNGEYKVQNLQGAIVESGTNSQQQELNSYNPDLKIEQFDVQNDNYDDVVHESSVPGYAEINILLGEQLYIEVRETVETKEETTEDNHTDAAEENCYADIHDGGGQALSSLQASKVHSYTLLTPREPPPVPKKSPELYRDLKLEAEAAQAETGFTEQSFNVTPPVVVCDENGTVIDFVYSEIGSDGENLGDGVDLSASGHSGLALFSKPVLNMNSNPDYESPETAMSDTGSYTDDIYTDPDVVQ